MNCNCDIRDGRNCIELVPIFSNLTHEEMLEVAAITTERTFKKGELIYMAGDNNDKLYVIHKGKVKITRVNDNGKEQVIRVIGPGEFMGELAIFNPIPATDNGEALEDSTMCIIGGENTRKLMERYPTITFKILEELSKRLEKAENLLENISLNTVEKRLASNLIKLSNENEVLLKMSKRDFASHIGMTQETLSRKLKHFQELGFIKLEGHRKIIILDKKGLAEIE